MKYIKLSKIINKNIVNHLNEGTSNNQWQRWQKYIKSSNLYNEGLDEYDIEDIAVDYQENLISAVLATLNKNGYQSQKESEDDFNATYYLDVKSGTDFYDICFCINGVSDRDRGRTLLPEVIFRVVNISNDLDNVFTEHLNPMVSLGISYPCATRLVYNVYRDKWFIKNTGWSGSQNTVECYYNYFCDNDDGTTNRLLNTLCEISQAIRPDTKYTNVNVFKI